MPEVLTVAQAREKVVKLAGEEKGLDWKRKTKLTVKGKISKVGEPRSNGTKQDIWLKDEAEGQKPVFLKVTVSNYKQRQDVGKLTEKDIGTEQTFTGVADVWEDRHSGEPVYSLFGEIGDGSRQRQSGGGGFGNPRNEALIAVETVLKAGMKSFAPIPTGKESTMAVLDRFNYVLNAMEKGDVVTRMIAIAAKVQGAATQNQETKENPEDKSKAQAPDEVPDDAPTEGDFG